MRISRLVSGRGRVVASCGLAATGLVFLVTGCAPEEPPPDRPDIVLITLDTTRADHLGCYGYFRDTSPWLDAFADGSIVFDRCVVPMATTLPTHTSILTATWPHEHGVLANLQHTGDYFAPSARLRSFATLCRDTGYRTGGFVSATPLKRGTGIEAGFEAFGQPRADQNQRPASETNAEALAWLDGVGEEPVFLWVHYYDPHWPFEPPPAYAERFATDDALDAWIEERRVPPRIRRPMTGEVDDARAVRNLYDAEIRYVDDQLRELFARLETRSRWDEALVAIVADHGEGLCQHGQTAHGATWDEQVRAPWILRVPGESARRIASTVSAVDVLPTLLGQLDERLGLHAFLEQASGTDVLSPHFRSRPVLSQDTGRHIGDPAAGRYHYALSTDRWKLVRSEPTADQARPDARAAPVDDETRGQLEALGYAGAGDDPDAASAAGETYRLFDLRADPYELEDVAAAHPDVVAALIEELRATLETQHRRGRELRD